jgi:hypothetical protein
MDLTQVLRSVAQADPALSVWGPLGYRSLHVLKSDHFASFYLCHTVNVLCHIFISPILLWLYTIEDICFRVPLPVIIYYDTAAD